MVGEGREELEKHFEKIRRERGEQEEEEARKQEAAKGFLAKVTTVFVETVHPALEDAADFLLGGGQSATVGFENDTGVVRLVLVATVDGREGRLTFAGEEATGKVKVSCSLPGVGSEALGQHPLDEITPDVVEQHLDYFYRGLSPQ